MYLFNDHIDNLSYLLFTIAIQLNNTISDESIFMSYPNQNFF